MDDLVVPPLADFHVHLRQGEMMKTVTGLVARGGADLAYVMPNLVPPITTTEQAVAYREALKAIEPRVQFLMTLYLSPSLTPVEVKKAADAGITGVKSYPRGVTTNSAAGIESYEPYFPVFEAMQEHGLVLNLHGEVPSDEPANIHVLNAEEQFLPYLIDLAKRFPRLKIVLEHVTTEAAVQTVKSLPENVAATITLHHLALTVDHVVGNAFHYCKPVAKTPKDREALRQVIREGHPRFFLGTDSAPHPIASKSAIPSSAGVFTSPILMTMLAQTLDEMGALDRLAGFGTHFGRAWYGIEPPSGQKEIHLRRVLADQDMQYVPLSFGVAPNEVVPFRAGKAMRWQIKEGL